MLYNHFVWQADAFLHGETTIQYPVLVTETTVVQVEGGQAVEDARSFDNRYFNDVSEVVDADGATTGRAQIPFPPLPAIILLPFVWAWGLAADQGSISIMLGALDTGIAFWFLGRLALGAATRAAMTVFIGAGSAFWYAASIGSTWYFAHVIAVGLTFLALGWTLRSQAAWDARGRGSPVPWVDWRQAAAGFALGLATTSRLTVAFGAVFFLFVGGGGTWIRRGISAAAGMALPVAALLLFTWASTGSLFNPVYEVLYQREVDWYRDLNYNGAWAISDPRYVPQNLGIMLTGLPEFMPACDAGVARTMWNEQRCSWAVPRPVGMSFLLASPAYLLALAVLRRMRDPRIAGALAAAGVIATVNLMHFSQGWVQFGYRFSLDFAPFLLIPVALGAERMGRRAAGLAVVLGLVALSVVIQAWGIAWARTLGW